MYFHPFVERRDKEMVLIVLPDLPMVGETVEVDLVVGGFSAEGLSIYRVFDGSHWSRGGGQDSNKRITQHCGES